MTPEEFAIKWFDRPIYNEPIPKGVSSTFWPTAAERQLDFYDMIATIKNTEYSRGYKDGNRRAFDYD